MQKQAGFSRRDTFKSRIDMWVTVTLDNFKFMARDLKFWILEVEEVYYLYRENNSADQLRSTARLICANIFAYAKTSGFLKTRHI